MNRPRTGTGGTASSAGRGSSHPATAGEEPLHRPTGLNDYRLVAERRLVVPPGRYDLERQFDRQHRFGNVFGQFGPPGGGTASGPTTTASPSVNNNSGSSYRRGSTALFGSSYSPSTGAGYRAEEEDTPAADNRRAAAQAIGDNLRPASGNDKPRTRNSTSN
ncbi:MAG: hypothetical protein ACLUEV_10130 [Alistipes sp.]